MDTLDVNQELPIQRSFMHNSLVFEIIGRAGTDMTYDASMDNAIRFNGSIHITQYNCDVVSTRVVKTIDRSS